MKASKHLLKNVNLYGKADNLKRIMFTGVMTYEEARESGWCMCESKEN
jgi:hypothetical protein